MKDSSEALHAGHGTRQGWEHTVSTLLCNGIIHDSDWTSDASDTASDTTGRQEGIAIETGAVIAAVSIIRYGLRRAAENRPPQMLDSNSTMIVLPDPCIFPNLGADRVAPPKHETCTKTFVLPNVRPLEAVEPAKLYQSAFALLLKAYVRTNGIAYGLVCHPESRRDGAAKSAEASVVSVQLDDTLTLLDNVKKLSENLLTASTGNNIDKGSNTVKSDHGFRQFNTTLCLTGGNLTTELDYNLHDSDLVMYLETNASKDTPDTRLKLTLSFSTHLCDQSSATNVISTFETILSRFENRLESPLGDVDLVSARDKEQITAWNATVPSPAHQTLNEVFERVFRENVDKEAVYTTAGCFTYGQLDNLSTVFALRLIEFGLKPNMVVPICMNKSRWVTCAMIAVWKAGGALTAMEPAHPDDRLIAIVKELKAKIIICDNAHAHRFEGLNVQILSGLENISENCEAVNGSVDRITAWRMNRVAPTDLAAIVFTSGSSGRPKGIINTHNRLTSEPENLFYGASFGYTKDARVLQFASYAYIPGIGENYRTLLNGATLCVPSEVERTSDLAGFIQRSGATRANMTPSLLRTFTPEDMPNLRDLIVGGEPVDSDLQQLWAKDRHVVQLYGSSEGGNWIKETTCSGTKSKGLLPIGCNQWLVDPQDVDKMVPIGAEGEVMLESHEMAIGYLNDPAKTARAFVEPPAWADKRKVAAGCRYLRLGDLARYESDGSITVLGRADTQVKIHGHRIELQDIENNLRTLLPDASEAVVELVKPFDATDRPLLTAFCRIGKNRKDNPHLHEGKDPGIAIPLLQQGLQKALPAHMVPKVFMMLKQLPQNSSSKTDRKKLRTDASNMGYERLLRYISNGAAESGEGMTNEREQIMAETWSRVLHQDVKSINRHDSFLARGGDSLAAIRLVPMLRSRGLNLTTQDILTHPTLKDMVETATDTDEDVHISTSIVSEPGNNTGIPGAITIVLKATDFQQWAALVGAQNGGWIDHFIYDFLGDLDVPLLQDSCQRLVATHSVLRSTFTFHEDGVLMVIPPTMDIAVNMHQASVSELESTSEQIYRRHRICPLGAPIVRFDLIEVFPTRHRLIIRLSHAQYDGFTASNIGQHLRSLYLSRAFPRTLPFHEYVKKIQEPGFVRSAEDFWKSHLQGSQMPKIVKRARPGPPFSNILNGEVCRLVADAGLQHRGISSAAVFKAAWALTVSALSQTRDVVFGDFVSGRQIRMPGIETVFGPCVNFLPVRVRLTTGLSNLDLVKQVQDDLFKAIPHESLGMKHIIQECTDWGLNARYSSIVNFINYDPGSGDEDWSSHNDGGRQLKVKQLYEEQQHDKTDLWLLCLPKHSSSSLDSNANSFELFLRYSKNVYRPSAIDRIADMYCKVMSRLAAAPEEMLTVPYIPGEERESLVPRVMV